MDSPRPIPGPPLWRAAAHGWRSLTRAHEVAWQLYQEYGTVVRVGAGPLAYTYLFGREANELILSAQPDAFTWYEALRFLEPVDGRTALVLSDGEDHRRRRRLVQPAFAMRRIDAGVPIVVEEVDAAIDTLRRGQVTDVYVLYRQAVRRIVTRILFGSVLAARADELGGALEPAMKYVDRPPQLQFRGAPGWRAARRSRSAADRLVDEEVARRRRAGELGEDILGALLATDLSDAELRDQVVSLIAAGYETTSGAVAWTVLELLRNPGVWARAQQEVSSRLPDGAPPTGDDLRAMPYVAAIVNETLRLWPPAPLSGRHAVRPVEFGSYRIPPGSMVLYSAYVTGRMPQLWGETAGSFRPDRWIDEEAQPFSFVPFGGAYRRCLGFALALAELQAVVVRLVQRTELSLLHPERPVRGIGLSSLRPDGGVPVIVGEVRPR